MKARYIYLAMMSVALTFGFTACDDDDDDSLAPVETPEASPIEFDTDIVTVGVGETTTFNITGGAGDYKVICENPDVATATVNGTVVTVSSSQKGLTGLVISDGAGSYKRIQVKSMYFSMSLDKEEVTIGMKLGHNDGYATVNVSGGNDGYKAVSSDESVVTVYSIEGSAIRLRGVKQGTATVTITDIMGLTKTVTVTVETTIIPYTDEEKEEIMASASDVFTFNGQSAYTWSPVTVSEDNGQTVISWVYYSYYILKCWFDGDTSVGKKTNGKVQSKFSWGGGNGDIYENVDVEIIKNDGSRVWGIMSVVKDDYLYYGHFCAGL